MKRAFRLQALYMLSPFESLADIKGYLSDSTYRPYWIVGRLAVQLPTCVKTHLSCLNDMKSYLYTN